MTMVGLKKMWLEPQKIQTQTLSLSDFNKENGFKKFSKRNGI